MKIKWLILISILGLVVVYFTQRPGDKVKVIFCDVGQGDGALIIDGDSQMLIDVGFDNGKMLKCLSNHVPFWDRKLEAVMVSHWDNDHSGALGSISKYYKIDNLIISQPSKDKIEQKYSSSVVSSGDEIKLGKIDFEVLSPGISGDDTNDGSLVGVLNYETKKILFMGDASSKVEQRLVWRNILQTKVDMLKVSHHGSAEGTSKELLETINPSVAVISVGANNKFGHPTEEVLKRLEDFRVKVYRTDRDGEVIVEWD